MQVIAVTLSLALLNLRGWALSRQASAARAREGLTLDSPADHAMRASWKASGRDGAGAELFSQPSQLDYRMQVVVRERLDRWRTLSLIGQRREILHGMVRMDDASCSTAAGCLPAEYLKSLASVTFASLALVAQKDARASDACGNEGAANGAAHRRGPRLLFLGLGAGALPSYVSQLLPDASLTAVDLDGTVAMAACEWLGLGGGADGAIEVVVADAAAWVVERAAEAADDAVASVAGSVGGYDAILIDVFDSRNMCPPALYSAEFLRAARSLLAPHGLIAHNLHTGSATLNATVNNAAAAYAAAFNTQQEGVEEEGAEEGRDDEDRAEEEDVAGGDEAAMDVGSGEVEERGVLLLRSLDTKPWAGEW